VPRVFVSYVHDNVKTVSRLVEDLRDRGVEVWYDRDALPPGVFWRDEIRRAVRDHEYFLACFSEEYARRARTYMNEELELAIAEVRVRGSAPWFIPVLLSGEIPDREIGAGRTIRDIQWVSLSAEEWDIAVDAIARAVGIGDVATLPSRRSTGITTQAPEPKDEDGFLTQDSVRDLVLGRVQGRQRLRADPILLFENSYQRTWLVITERIVGCVLDDIEKPAAYDPLRWSCRHKFAMPVEVEQYKDTVGVLHLGPEHRDWLYSVHLHPDSEHLRRKVESLLTESAA
jgi:TIR domain